MTFGYHSSFCRLKSVNKIPIQNIYHLAEVCDQCTDEFLQFDMDRSAHFLLLLHVIVSVMFCAVPIHAVRPLVCADVCGCIERGSTTASICK